MPATDIENAIFFAAGGNFSQYYYYATKHKVYAPLYIKFYSVAFRERNSDVSQQITANSRHCLCDGVWRVWSQVAATLLNQPVNLFVCVSNNKGILYSW
jgi:hypothetical protein